MQKCLAEPLTIPSVCSEWTSKRSFTLRPEGLLVGKYCQAGRRLTDHLHTSIPEQLQIDMVEAGHFLGLQAADRHGNWFLERAGKLQAWHAEHAECSFEASWTAMCEALFRQRL